MGWYSHFKHCSQQARAAREKEKAKASSMAVDTTAVDPSAKRKIDTFNLLEANGIDSLSQSQLTDYFKDN